MHRVSRRPAVNSALGSNRFARPAPAFQLQKLGTALDVQSFRISFKCLSTTLGRFRAWSQGAELSEPNGWASLLVILVSITLKRCSFFQQFSIVLWQNVALPNPMASRPLREALPSLRPAPSRHAPRPCLGGAIMLIWQAASNLTRDRLNQMGARE